jgi:hypothetical protein
MSEAAGNGIKSSKSGLEQVDSSLVNDEAQAFASADWRAQSRRPGPN